jgi:hypothetical protein
MYICPTCNQTFESADDVAKHSLGCWREHNPNHKSKPAPRSEDIVTREISDELANFFKQFERN